MPLIKLTISNIDKINCQELMKEVSKIAGEESGKGEDSIMVIISEGKFLMRREETDCAFVDFRGIGKIEKEVNAAISIRISQTISDHTNILSKNIYLNFTDIPRENWGHSEGVY